MYELKDLFVEITNQCLQKCIHCSSCAENNGFSYIPFEHLVRLVNEALPIGAESFTISGGEPFLYPELKRLIDFLHEKKITTSIYTCGVIENCQNQFVPISEDMFAYLKEREIAKVIFSLHGGTEATQHKISCLKDSCRLVKESVKNAMKCNLTSELHVVPMKTNIDELDLILEFAEQQNISCVSFLRYVPQGRGNESLELSNDDWNYLKVQYESWIKQYHSITIRFGTPFNCLTLDGKTCTAGKNKLLISATGECFPCEAFKYLKGLRPTIYENNLSSIWMNDSLLKQVRCLTVEQIEYCKSCDLRSSCHGGCAGQRFRYYGNLMKGPDPHCLKPVYQNVH